MALHKTLARLDKAVAPQCVAAYDHSDVCVSIYNANHDGQATQSRIELLKDVPEVDVWFLSPPCQPHSRQHDKKCDMQDSRSVSFLHLCGLVSDLESRPMCIFVENVVGFETSGSFDKWVSAVQPHYKTCHFHLNPTQVGIPNDRPRYYQVSIRKNCFDSSQDGSKLFDGKTIHAEIPHLGVLHDKVFRPLSHYIDDDVSVEPLLFPAKLHRSTTAWSLDIVTKQSTTPTACFTAAYGKYVRGTGSVLYMGKETDVAEREEAEKRQYSEDWMEGLEWEKLRYFASSELQKIFGFDDSFAFPEKISQKQQWKCIGNSLNVDVASKVIELGLRLCSPLQ